VCDNFVLVFCPWGRQSKGSEFRESCYGFFKQMSMVTLVITIKNKSFQLCYRSNVFLFKCEDSNLLRLDDHQTKLDQVSELVNMADGLVGPKYG
jgi:hypothetical protein